MTEAVSTRRKAPVRRKALRIDAERYPDFGDWVFVAWVNAPWQYVEELFEPNSLGAIRETLETIVLGPWNFVDSEGKGIGEPYEGTPPEGPGPWSMPVKSEVEYILDEDTGIRPRIVHQYGSIHKLGPDLIRAMLGTLQGEITTLPND